MQQSKCDSVRITDYILYMMRCGKSLGTLNWETDKIYLMNSKKPESSKKLLDKIKNGKFIKE